jgi:flagellar hook-associated protein 1
MAGLFSTLGIGTRGLAASQLALDITGQNISNANTEGYSRKRLSLNADYRADPQFGSQGMGVNIKDITRMRDSFLDTQIRAQQQTLSDYTAQDATLEQIENIFTEPSDSGL